jgi:hypothetical protein
MKWPPCSVEQLKHQKTHPKFVPFSCVGKILSGRDLLTIKPNTKQCTCPPPEKKEKKGKKIKIKIPMQRSSHNQT